MPPCQFCLTFKYLYHKSHHEEAGKINDAIHHVITYHIALLLRTQKSWHYHELQFWVFLL